MVKILILMNYMIKWIINQILINKKIKMLFLIFKINNLNKKMKFHKRKQMEIKMMIIMMKIT